MRTKTWELDLKGFQHPTNEDLYDQSKNVWVIATEETLLYHIDGVANVTGYCEIEADEDEGVDYVLPRDLEKFMVHIKNTETNYE